MSYKLFRIPHKRQQFEKLNEQCERKRADAFLPVEFNYKLIELDKHSVHLLGTAYMCY